MRNLGDTNQVLILEDHGPLVACPTIEESFALMYFLTRACQFQINSLSAAGADLSKIHVPEESTLNEMVRRMEKFDEAPSSTKDVEDKPAEHDTPGLMFAYARRSAENEFGSESIYR